VNPDAPAHAARELCRTARRAQWTGPDIYDGLAARWPRVLTGGRRRRQALIQLHARSPVDLRPLSRRTHAPIAKGVALFAQAELALASLGDRDAHHAAAEAALQRVAADHGAGPVAWGYPWDVQTRWSHYRAGTPNVIVTAFAARALEQGAAALDRPEFAERARAGAHWVQEALFMPDAGAYAYHPGSPAVIHNASLLGARAAWTERARDPRVQPAVAQAVRRVLAAQRPDGAFPYGEGPGLEFVDSFHTGYVLECLCDLREAAPGVDAAVAAGFEYYRDRFFDERGRALLWPSKEFPEDAHSAGTAMSTIARLARDGVADMSLLTKVAERAAGEMTRSGHAIHRRYRWGPTRVRYVRWADAHMAKGLAAAAVALDGQR